MTSHPVCYRLQVPAKTGAMPHYRWPVHEREQRDVSGVSCWVGCRHALHCLELNLHHLNEQIEIKLNSQHIDAQCLAARDKLLPIHPMTGPDVNKQLVGIHRLREQVLPY